MRGPFLQPLHCVKSEASSDAPLPQDQMKQKFYGDSRMFKIAQRCYPRSGIEPGVPPLITHRRMTLRSIALAVALLAAPSAYAQDIASFVVANEDGYGIDACLQSGSSCGQPVATAWC